MKKKTIAILLVLVIGMVGVFASETPANPTSSAKINLTTSVDSFTYFGVSSAALGNDDYLSATAFLLKAKEAIGFSSDINNFVTTEGGLTVGYISGLTNQGVDVVLQLTVTPFTPVAPEGGGASPYAGASIPLTLEAPTENLTILKATNTLGKLASTPIKVSATAANVALAPATDYEATVTINVYTDSTP